MREATLLAKLPGTKAFFAYARARHSIYIQRMVQHRPWPWTADPILQQYRFCNVFRELDTTTAWFRLNIREPLLEAPTHLQVRAAVAFRWFNRIETFDTLLTAWEGAGARELIEGWNADTVATVLRQDGKPPWVTGSYIIKTPDGMDKLTGVLWCIDNFIAKHETAIALRIDDGPVGLYEVWQMLSEAPFLGDFMAYEVVTDLRHTPRLKDAPDAFLWANPGPGACRGMARVMGQPLDHFNRANTEHRRRVNGLMQELLWLSENQALWPEGWGKWEMREVEHTLCEFDKYERARLGQGKPRQKFRRKA